MVYNVRLFLDGKEVSDKELSQIPIRSDQVDEILMQYMENISTKAIG